MMQQGLTGIRVLEFSDQIAGPYCSKLLVDGGAEVIKVESPDGDSLRHWSASCGDLHGEASALFTFLNAGKQSVVGTATDPHVEALLADADLVIEAHGLESDSGARLDVARLRAAHPSLVVLSITPYGLTGPWADRQATEFTIQAESGSIGVRGLMGEQPSQAGRRISDRSGGQQRRGERQRQDSAASLLQDEDQILESQAGAAVRFRDRHRCPAGVGQRLPELSVAAIAVVGDGADVADLAGAAQQLSQAAAQ
ncbi:MAG: CoA transferase [Chloroflexi bacterium]|nr:CoA transferase [Chloroflexota bacterium]